jgi:hypothetical protein
LLPNLAKGIFRVAFGHAACDFVINDSLLVESIFVPEYVPGPGLVSRGDESNPRFFFGAAKFYDFLFVESSVKSLPIYGMSDLPNNK